MTHRVLIVDDEPSICWTLDQALQDDGYQCKQAATAEEALRVAPDFQPEVILLDVRLPGMSGLDALSHLQEQCPEAAICVMTAFGDLETAVAAIRSSAFEYITKPFELDHALEVVQRAVRSRSEPVVSLVEPESPPPAGMVGASPVMQQVFKQVAQAANCDVPVLVTGESGTGKELIAEAIHRHSHRSAQPFLPVCLAAMNENLVESELFGHVRGSFTGAENDRRGVLEMADQGTVFLDEIGDVPLGVQVKLLRAIERHEWLAVGDVRPRRGDFRVVAATHRPLAQMIQEGTFREDLYYRLCVFHIQLPPLRDRLDDLELLAQHFLRLIAGDQPPKRLSEAALMELKSRPWYGNVRELKNVVEHAAIVSRSSEIGPEHLPRPLELSAPSEDASTDHRLIDLLSQWAKERLQQEEGIEALYERMLELVEPPVLEAALESVGGNRLAAAAKLGIHRTTLRQKMRRHGMDESSSEKEST